MRDISRRYAARQLARFVAKTTFDEDLRPGELAGAVARAKSGDEAAVRYLYLRFRDNIFGYARSIVCDEHEAEDVTQQVFTRMITAIGSYEQRGVPFSAWLLRIAHNMAIDHLRRQRAVVSEDPGARTETEELPGELASELRGALADLPPAQREVVVLRHISGCTPPEIAERLHKSEEAVHGLHHRGRRALQAALAERGAVPVVAG